MKIVGLFRDSAGAKYIANVLAEAEMIDTLILETGHKARKRKMRRMMRKARWWQVPLRLLDIVSIAVYSRICERHLLKVLLRPKRLAEYPKAIPRHTVDDANDSDCVSFFESLEPDIAVVYGTSLLKKRVLEIPRMYLLNVHGGIVPEYRNVHSDFWAFRNRDYARIGVSIIYLDAGIDTGDVALQSVIDIKPGDNLLSVKIKNLELGGRLITEALRQAGAGSLPRHKQPKLKTALYPTPGFLDLIRGLRSLL